jgi:hypothetical protein
VGGGVIQDIATFSASIYMRGIQWTYMPTTLLSMTDSCIGGKSSINVLKNKRASFFVLKLPAHPCSLTNNKKGEGIGTSF